MVASDYSKSVLLHNWMWANAPGRKVHARARKVHRAAPCYATRPPGLTLALSCLILSLTMAL